MYYRSMKEYSDESALISGILARDRRALSVFYRRFTPKLAVYIRAKVGNQNDAEEILQDTLFAFLEAIRDFQGEASLTTYLRAICHHKIVDYYRKKKIKQLVFSQMPNLEALVSQVKNPEEQLDSVLLKEKIQTVLGSLIPQYRRMLVSKYIEHLSVEEIAHKFALTLKGAESKLFRARRAFVELFVSI